MSDQALAFQIADYIVDSCGVGISRIQSHFGLSYSMVLDSLSMLVKKGLISGPGSDGCYQLTEASMKQVRSIPPTSWSPARRYVRRLAQLVRFVCEHFEEGRACDTQAVEKVLSPVPGQSGTEMRAFLEDRFTTGASPLEAALAMHTWFVDEKCVAMPKCVTAALTDEFRNWTSDRAPVLDESSKIERAYMRLARHIRERHQECPDEEGAQLHTRIFEFFIPRAFVPRGVALNLEGPDVHHEHVVPCAYLRNVACRLFAKGQSDEEVATFIRRCLAVVIIRKADAQKLDQAMGLKNTMPAGWDPIRGDIFARLRLANIPFVTSPVDAHATVFE